jgi:hypothetical protein
VMTTVLGKSRFRDYAKLAVWEIAQSAIHLHRTKNATSAMMDFWWRLLAFCAIVRRTGSTVQPNCGNSS